MTETFTYLMLNRTMMPLTLLDHRECFYQWIYGMIKYGSIKYLHI